MKKISNELSLIVKDITGNMCIFGNMEEKVLKRILSNKKIGNCDVISEYNGGFSFFKGESNTKGKKFNIKKIKKIYSKNGIDYSFINYDEFKKYKKTLFRDCINISSCKIYIFSEDEYFDTDYFLKKFKKYNCVTESIKCDDGYILVINTENSKQNFFINKIYYIKDTFYDVIDAISEFLIN